MAITVACFLPFLGALTRIRLRERDQEAGTREPFLRQLRDGALVAVRHPVIRVAMLMTGLFSIVGRGALEILPAIADGAFERGASGLGQIAAAGGAGALIASTFMAVRNRQVVGRLPRISVVSVFAGFGLCIVLGLTQNWAVALAAVVGIGFCGATVGIGLQSTVQLSLTDTYRGRVMSLWTVLGIGGAAVGAILLGWLADIAGFGIALGWPGAIGIVGASALLIWARRSTK